MAVERASELQEHHLEEKRHEEEHSRSCRASEADLFLRFFTTGGYRGCQGGYRSD